MGANYRAPGVQEDKLPTQEELQTLVDMNLTQKMQCRTSHWLSKFHISYRKVSQYHQGRVFIMGDAAHIHSPAGGQGMNTGIQDAINLGWKLAMVLKDQADATLLDTYFAERSPVAEGVLKDTENLTRLVTLKQPFIVKLRNKLVPLLLNVDFFQQKMVAKMAEVAFNYRHSPIVSQDWASSVWDNFTGIVAGDRAPSAVLLDQAQNKKINLFDLFGLEKFKALLFTIGNEPNAQLGDIARHLTESYGDIFDVVLIAPAYANTLLQHAKHVLIDSTGDCYQRYHVKQPAVYFIRPDGYIAYRNQPANWQSCERYLTDVLSLTSRVAT